MPLSILQVITKNEVGGAQEVTRQLANGLIKNHAQVSVCTGIAGNYFDTQLNGKDIKIYKMACLMRTYSVIKNVLFIFKLKKLLDTHNVDVVHFHSTNSIFGAIGAKLSKSKPKTVFTFHGLSYLDPDSGANVFAKIIFYVSMRFALKFIDEKIFICLANFEYARKINLVKTGRIIYNGIDNIGHFEKHEAKNLLSKMVSVSLADKIVIGSVGRLAYPKNYEFFIKNFPEIINRVPNALGLLIGGGPEFKKYELLIKSLGLADNIKLTGEVVGASKSLQAFDIFILTSKFEGVPMTMLEALSAGVPAIGPRVGGIPELEKYGVITYEPDNACDFLQKIATATNGHLIDRLSANTEFSAEKMIENYIKLYMNS